MAEAARKIDPDPHGYRADPYLWSAQQAHLLRAGRFGEIDLEHVAEEIALVGLEHERAISSQMARIVEHLMKLEFTSSPYPKRGWRRTIREGRTEVAWIVQRIPSLRNFPAEIFAKAHEAGATAAFEALELHGELSQDIADDLFARQYTIDQVLSDWLPRERAGSIQ